MNIGERIKNRRLELKLSQDELAQKIGYKSRSSINKIELGLTDINQSKIIKFAKALETTPGFLMGLEQEQPQEVHSNLSKSSHSLLVEVSPHEYELIKKYRLLSAKEQAAVDNLIDSLASSSDNIVKTKSNSKTIEKLGKTIEKLGVDPTPENGFISHKDMVGKGIAAFGGNKKKFKF